MIRSACRQLGFTRRVASVLLVILGFSFGAAQLGAHDLNPPGYRGGVCSTVASWVFGPASADTPSNLQPDGPIPSVIGDFAPFLNAAFPGSAPFPSGSAFGCSFALSGGISGGAEGCQIGFNLPNCIDEEPVKYMRIQVTYSGPVPTTTGTQGFLGVPGSSAGVVEELLAQVSDTSLKLPADCRYFYQDWRMQPNPDWEQVVLNVPAGTTIKQLIIDTISTRTRRFPICQWNPYEILSSSPTTITLAAEFPDGIPSILTVQALFELLSGPAPRQPIDITALLVPFITEVTDTTGTIVIPNVAFPPGTRASVTFNLKTTGDTSAGFFATDELTIDVPE